MNRVWRRFFKLLLTPVLWITGSMLYVLGTMFVHVQLGYTATQGLYFAIVLGVSSMLIFAMGVALREFYLTAKQQIYRENREILRSIERHEDI